MNTTLETNKKRNSDSQVSPDVNNLSQGSQAAGQSSAAPFDPSEAARAAILANLKANFCSLESQASLADLLLLQKMISEWEDRILHDLPQKERMAAAMASCLGLTNISYEADAAMRAEWEKRQRNDAQQG